MWELVARSGLITKALFPTPLQTWEAAKSLWRSGVVGGDLRASLGRVAVGFLIGSALGIAVGFATGVSRACNALLGPIITFLRPIPAIAVVPLSTAWFGIGQKGKYFIIAYAVVLAVWLYVHDGVARIPSVYVRVAKGYGLGRVKVLKRVLIPAAGPAIVSALRYGSSVAFLALVAAELGGAQNGIAYRLQVDSQFLQTGRIFVGLIELGVLGVSADYLIAKTGKRFVHWSTS
jgi:NitT/TauT family transport system permease protein